MRHLIIAVAVILTMPAHAADLAARALDYGVTELGMGGSYLHAAEEGAGHNLSIELRGGRMMGAGMELELEGSLGRAWQADHSYTTIGATGSFLYNIRTYASWVPFFMAGGGLQYDRWSEDDRSGSDTDALVHFGVGTKFFFTESAALRIEYRFRSLLADPESVNIHTVLAGVSVFLG